MRHTFNSLLIALVAIDIGFLFFKIWDSIWRGLDLRTTPHTILFPKFLYPMNSITLTASIYMIVAISIERYRTLCYPTNVSVNSILESMIHELSGLCSQLFQIERNLPCILVPLLVWQLSSTFQSSLRHQQQNMMGVSKITVGKH